VHRALHHDIALASDIANDKIEWAPPLFESSAAHAPQLTSRPAKSIVSCRFLLVSHNVRSEGALGWLAAKFRRGPAGDENNGARKMPPPFAPDPTLRSATSPCGAARG